MNRFQESQGGRLEPTPAEKCGHPGPLCGGRAGFQLPTGLLQACQAGGRRYANGWHRTGQPGAGVVVELLDKSDSPVTGVAVILLADPAGLDAKGRDRGCIRGPFGNEG